MFWIKNATYKPLNDLNFNKFHYYEIRLSLKFWHQGTAKNGLRKNAKREAPPLLWLVSRKVDFDPQISTLRETNQRRTVHNFWHWLVWYNSSPKKFERRYKVDLMYPLSLFVIYALNWRKHKNARHFLPHWLQCQNQNWSSRNSNTNFMTWVLSSTFVNFLIMSYSNLISIL